MLSDLRTIGRAGLPTTVTPAGTSSTTTAPQPINALINRVWLDVEDHIPAVIVACWCERLFELRAAANEANKRAVPA